MARYHATDISPGMIQIAKERADAAGLLELECSVANLFDPSLDKGGYDAVLAFNLLHLIDNIPAALQRAHALLRPGGLFISKTICAPERRPPLTFAAMRAVLPLMQWIGYAPPVTFLRVAVLDEMVRAEGFDLIETGNHPANPPRRYIVARKV